MAGSRQALWSRVLLVSVLMVAAAGGASAQSGGGPAGGTAAADANPLPDATFTLTFNKYTAPRTVYSPFHSWDASMGLRLALASIGSGAIVFTGEVQSVGTENFGSRVSVGGTGYLLGVGYDHAWSADARVSTGIAHLSSHLTRDLDEKVEDQRNRGAPIPVVDDPDEYNVIFVSVRRQFATWLLAPEFEVTVHPVNVRFSGGRHGTVRPLLVRTAFTLWRRGRTRLAAETRHEIGPNAFNHYALVFGRSRGDRQTDRLEVFVSASPGNDFHVSPTMGALRDGVALGVRVKFDGR